MKIYKKSPTGAAVLTETMQRLGMTQVELSEALGMARNFVHGCVAKGEAPAWVDLACHGLRDLARDAAERPAVFVIQAAADQTQDVRTMLRLARVRCTEVAR